MKTIAEIAKELGVSRQSVYARVKESGVNLDKLTKERIGKQTFFDDDAVKVIMSACQKERVKKEHVKNDNKTRNDELTKQIETLTRELEEARSKIMEDQQEIARLKKHEDEMLEIIRMKEYKEAQQALRIEAQQPNKIGIVGKIKELFGGKKNEGKEG